MLGYCIEGHVDLAKNFNLSQFWLENSFEQAIEGLYVDFSKNVNFIPWSCDCIFLGRLLSETR